MTVVSGQIHSLRSVATLPCPHAHEDPGEVAEPGGPPHLNLDVGTASGLILQDTWPLGESQNPGSCPELKKVLSPWLGQWLMLEWGQEEPAGIR